MSNDGRDFYRFHLMILGSGLVVLGSGFGLVAAFKGDILTVYLSLIGFVTGYKVAQIGLHNGRESKSIFKDLILRAVDYSRLDKLSVLAGSVLMTLGFVTLAKSITQFEASMAAAAAVTMGSGYMVEHWAINNTLV